MGMQRSRAGDATTHHHTPVIIRARSRGKHEDGRVVHTITIAANEEVSRWHDPVDIATLDIETFMRAPTVLFQHDRSMPVAKTLALKKVKRNKRTEIDADFVFDKASAKAREVEAWWDDGIISAASIDWDEFPRSQGGGAYLSSWSLVSVPADRDAVKRMAPIYGRSMPSVFSAPSTAEEPMDPNELQKILEAALANVARGRSDIDATALAEALAPTLGTALTTSVDAAVQKAVDAVQAKVDAANDDAEKARAAKEAADGELKTQREAVRAEERERTRILIKATPFLPDDFDPEDKTNRQILEAAMEPQVGTERARSAHTTDGYLEARLDIEVERRAKNPNRREAPAVHHRPGSAGSGADRDRVYLEEGGPENNFQPRVRSGRLDEARDEYRRRLRTGHQTVQMPASAEAFQAMIEDGRKHREEVRQAHTDRTDEYRRAAER